MLLLLHSYFHMNLSYLHKPKLVLESYQLSARKKRGELPSFPFKVNGKSEKREK